MPATSEVASKVVKEKRCLATNACTVVASRGSSTLMPTIRRPREAKTDRGCRSSRICSPQDGDVVDQKFSRTELPRNEGRFQVLPARSGNENSGALKGSMSHVSTAEGKGSGFGASPARE